MSAPEAPETHGGGAVSTLLPPEPVWWKRIGPDERTWLTIAFIWCLILFTGMIIWRVVGDQHAPVESYTVDEEVFLAEVEQFIEERQIGEEAGVPIVEPEVGEDVYLHASQFQFRPIPQLRVGETYRLLVSSTDVQHGLSIPHTSLNFQVLPGYLYVIRITPQETGEFSLVCNEYSSAVVPWAASNRYHMSSEMKVITSRRWVATSSASTPAKASSTTPVTPWASVRRRPERSIRSWVTSQVRTST